VVERRNLDGFGVEGCAKSGQKWCVGEDELEILWYICQEKELKGRVRGSSEEM
jgi:hypothetical protein